MKIGEIMTRSICACEPESNLSGAGKMLIDSDCGILPVVNRNNQVIGVLTDRDIMKALVTEDRQPSDITAQEIVRAPVHVCTVEEEVLSVLHRMAQHQIRRIPVVDSRGSLVGIISIHDVILEAKKEESGLSGQEVFDAMYGICAVS